MLNCKKKNHKTITKVKCPVKNDFIHNPKDIPDVFNKYFSNIGQSLASKVPESHIHFSHYLKENYSNSFYFNPVMPYEIESEITLLSCSKSVGLFLSKTYAKMHKTIRISTSSRNYESFNSERKISI